MSTTSAVSRAAKRSVMPRPHPQVLDRAVMRVGFALVSWAQRRTDRHAAPCASLVAEQQQLRVAQERALVQREREWALREHRLTA